MSFFELFGQCEGLTQWDIGRKLIVNGACTHVHYAKAEDAEAIVCKVEEKNGVRTAPVPDEVLQAGGSLWVYAFVLGEEGYTKIIQSFYVKPRPKPVNYVYTPTEVMTWEGLHERVEALEESGGVAGGYYLPAVEQVDATTAKVSFTASGEEMPEVAPQSLTLPAGPRGLAGADGYAILPFMYSSGGALSPTWPLSDILAPDTYSEKVGDLVVSTDGYLYRINSIDEQMGNAVLVLLGNLNGQDGYTPVKGVDYYTEGDKEELVEAVTEAVRAAEEKEISYTEHSGNYYGIDGEWITGEGTNVVYTNLIPVAAGDCFSYTGRGPWYVASVLWYDENKNFLSAQQYIAEDGESITTATVTAPGMAAFVRFQSYGSGSLTVEYDPEGAVDISDALVKSGVLYGKKIVYDGDSICYGAGYKGGYAKLIAEKVGGSYDNQGVGGGRLITAGTEGTFHSVVDNLVNLPGDGDLYCFEGGINDYWTYGVLGTYDDANFDGELDTATVCGALETIFRYALNTFVGKPVCFVITHKIQGTAYSENANGDRFKDYHDAMVGICEKYSIPYYDAFSKSGLNGWNTAQNNAYLTGNSEGTPDGCHPNEQGYRRYYVPQLINLFESMMPTDVTEPGVAITNVLDAVGYTADQRLSGSAGTLKENTGTYVTGQIAVNAGDVIRLKNVTMPHSGTGGYGNQVAFYAADGSFTMVLNIHIDMEAGYGVVSDGTNITQFTVTTSVIGGGDSGFIRICANYIGDDSVITINEPIG